jgi:PAS domain S-box-containing protein
MATIHNNKWRSVRFWLPALLLLFTLGGGLILYIFEVRLHEAVFESDFNRNQTFRSIRIQSDVERWVQRNDLETVQSIFAEQGLIPELKSALFLDATNIVLASTRREDLGRPLNIEHLGLAKLNSGRLIAAMQTARQTTRGISLFTDDRNGLVACFPASLPPSPGELGMRQGGVILVGYDLLPEKIVSLRHVQAEFLAYFAGILVIAMALGVSLHFLITRRLERLKSAMTDFASGKAVTGFSPGPDDEIAHLVGHFREMAATIRGTMEEIQDLYERAPCGYHSLDASGTFVRINATELSWLGYTREETVGKLKFSNLLTPQSLELFHRQFPKFKERGFVNDLDFEVVRRDGSIMPVILSATAIKDAQGNFLMSRSVMHDVTERKPAENALRRLNRELRAISNCNQILMRATDEPALLQDICRIVCDEAGYRMAWVGFAELDEARSVRPVAVAGIEDGYLAQAEITWADTERGRGPTGKAIRSGASVCVQDFETAPKAAPWRENALSRGYRSSIALPLKDEKGAVFGAFMIYSTEPNVFTPGEIRLLEELASDLAFGINVLRGRVKRQQAERSLLGSEEKYRTLIQKLQTAVVVHGADTRIIICNPVAQTLLGLTEDQLLGKTALDPAWHFFREDRTLMPPEEYPVNQVLATRQPLKNLVLGVHRPGSEPDVWAMVNANPVFGPGNEILEIIVTFIDVTGRRQAEEKLAYLAAIVECSDDAIIGKTLDETIVSWNRGAERIYGYTAAEIVGRSIAMLIPPELKVQLAVIMERLKAGEIIEHLETTRVRKDGQVIHVALTISPIKDARGQIVGASTIARDITERKRVEEVLQKRNDELERLERLVVGRELKMVELKSRIACLEAAPAKKQEREHEN